MPALLTGCTFSLIFPHYVVTASDQVSAKVDLITFLITTEPSPGKQNLEKVQMSDVSISLVCCQSGSPGQCCCDHLSMLRQPSFPGSVCTVALVTHTKLRE